MRGRARRIPVLRSGRPADPAGCTCCGRRPSPGPARTSDRDARPPRRPAPCSRTGTGPGPRSTARRTGVPARGSSSGRGRARPGSRCRARGYGRRRTTPPGTPATRRDPGVNATAPRRRRTRTPGSAARARGPQRRRRQADRLSQGQQSRVVRAAGARRAEQVRGPALVLRHGDDPEHDARQVPVEGQVLEPLSQPVLEHHRQALMAVGVEKRLLQLLELRAGEPAVSGPEPGHVGTVDPCRPPCTGFRSSSTRRKCTPEESDDTADEGLQPSQPATVRTRIAGAAPHSHRACATKGVEPPHPPSHRWLPLVAARPRACVPKNVLRPVSGSFSTGIDKLRKASAASHPVVSATSGRQFSPSPLDGAPRCRLVHRNSRAAPREGELDDNRAHSTGHGP